MDGGVGQKKRTAQEKEGEEVERGREGRQSDGQQWQSGWETLEA